MLFSPPLIRAELRRRYKRFLADVRVGDDELVVHCANPGRMTTCAEEGGVIWLFDSENPKRKLRYTWELADISGDMVCVNTARGNQLVGAALEADEIAELAGYETLEREVRIGDSRIDFALSAPDRRRCFVEVKTVTLRSAKNECAFPDSVTERGRRHLGKLIELVQAGNRAVMLFVCGRTPTSRIRPADEIDPDYGNALRDAAAAGVELLCYGTKISVESIRLDVPIPVVLE